MHVSFITSNTLTGQVRLRVLLFDATQVDSPEAFQRNPFSEGHNLGFVRDPTCYSTATPNPGPKHHGKAIKVNTRNAKALTMTASTTTLSVQYPLPALFVQF